MKLPARLACSGAHTCPPPRLPGCVLSGSTFPGLPSWGKPFILPSRGKTRQFRWGVKLSENPSGGETRKRLGASAPWEQCCLLQAWRGRRGDLVAGGRQPQRPPNSSPICIFPSPNKMKKRNDCLLSLTFFFLTSAHSALYIPEPPQRVPSHLSLAVSLPFVCLLPTLRSRRASLRPWALPPCSSRFFPLLLRWGCALTASGACNPCPSVRARAALPGSHQLPAPP